MIPMAKSQILKCKKGLVLGVASEQSIFRGCAKAVSAFGAELAFTYLNQAVPDLGQ